MLTNVIELALVLLLWLDMTAFGCDGNTPQNAKIVPTRHTIPTMARMAGDRILSHQSHYESLVIIALLTWWHSHLLHVRVGFGLADRKPCLSSRHDWKLKMIRVVSQT